MSQNDNTIWDDYLDMAEKTDDRILKDWNSVIDVILVFVRGYVFVLSTLPLL